MECGLYAVFFVRVGRLRSLARVPPAFSYSLLFMPYRTPTPANMRWLNSRTGFLCILKAVVDAVHLREQGVVFILQGAGVVDLGLGLAGLGRGVTGIRGIQGGLGGGDGFLGRRHTAGRDIGSHEVK